VGQRLGVQVRLEVGMLGGANAHVTIHRSMIAWIGVCYHLNRYYLLIPRQISSSVVLLCQGYRKVLLMQSLRQ
jgi:hypothetical protein